MSLQMGKSISYVGTQHCCVLIFGKHRNNIEETVLPCPYAILIVGKRQCRLLISATNNSDATENNIKSLARDKMRPNIPIGPRNLIDIAVGIHQLSPLSIAVTGECISPRILDDITLRIVTN